MPDVPVVLGQQVEESSTTADHAGAGAAQVDLLCNRFVRASPDFCEILGVAEESLCACGGLAELAHPEDQAELAQAWAALRSTGRSVRCEQRYLRPDGTTVWAHLIAYVSAWSNTGQPLRATAILQDITARKEAESSTQASQDLLRLALEIGGVGTFRRDYVTGFIHCDHQTRVMNGLPLGDKPVPDLVWLLTVVPADRARLAQEAAAAHAERREVVTYTYAFVHPQTGIRFAHTRSRVDYNAAGQAVASIGVIIDVTEQRQTEVRLTHLAHHDVLTNLPNRSLFRLRLDQALGRARAGERSAIVYIDLDHFKDINDTLGHPVGDALLKIVTDRLRASCRPTDTVARLGGDEFAIILSPALHDQDTAAFADRVIAAVGQPYQIDGLRCCISTSVGIAVVPDHGLDADDILQRADLALYSAKEAGRNRHQFFEPAMERRKKARYALVDDMRQALARDAFELFYQPIVCLSTRSVQGFEALIRWRHHERGLVAPAEFIPLAEASGMSLPIGTFVIHRACQQAVLWPCDLSVAVNVSAAQFSSSDFLHTVSAALRQSRLDPHRLEIEVVETTVLQDTEATLNTLHRLKALGVRLSIDDFGTGFSSLGYLQRFPFDKVKIDRSFVTPLGQPGNSLAIVRAVIDLCNGLDMNTTAEGIESEDQLAILTQLGCKQGQGFYFSRPLPYTEVPRCLQQLGLPQCGVPVRPSRGAASGK